MKAPFLFLFCLALLFPVSGQQADPSKEDSIASMKAAVGFFRSRLSQGGGYASEWTLEPFRGFTEHGAGKTVFSIQPHGTTTVGLAMLRAYEATGEKEFLEGANEAGSALAKCQLSSGGWSSEFDFDPEYAKRYHLRTDLDQGDTDPGKRRRLSTLDDNKTQSALLLLLELAMIPDNHSHAVIQEAIEFGLDSLLAAQNTDGSWPQQYDEAADPNLEVLAASFPEEWSREYPKLPYYRYATLNDGNLVHVMSLLLRAHKATGNKRFLDSAKRLGDFLLRAQLPEPQRAWAQQYDENRHPAWARKFEPPAISSIESMGACEALLELWIASGEDRYRATIPDALRWMESSQLEDGRWARFYELETNRPLYCEAETYQVTYDGSNTPTHYGFKIDSGFGRKMERMRKSLEKSREKHLEQQAGPNSKEAWEKRARDFRGKAKQALSLQHEDGYWLKGDRIDAREFVKRMTDLTSYVEALSKQ
ncbi:MAG: pectate lyase [Verrucomicrobiales bacterium]|nr:pectate lyase [Verrucomicrobiales bacterium]